MINSLKLMQNLSVLYTQKKPKYEGPFLVWYMCGPNLYPLQLLLIAPKLRNNRAMAK